MAIHRSSSFIFGIAVTVILVLAVSVQLTPKLHMAVLSEKTAEKISGDVYTNSTIDNVPGLSLGTMGASSFKSIMCNSTGPSQDEFNDIVLYFNSTSAAGRMYGNLSQNLTENSLIPTHRSTYWGFEYIYLFPHHTTPLNSLYAWDVCGLNSHYLFVIAGYSGSLPIENMTAIAQDQINVMETSSL